MREFIFPGGNVWVLDDSQELGIADLGRGDQHGRPPHRRAPQHDRDEVRGADRETYPSRHGIHSSYRRDPPRPASHRIVSPPSTRTIGV